jgi:hypothetical protein
MIPLCMSQRCQWHDCAMCSRVFSAFKKNNGDSDHSRKYSTKLVGQRCHLHRCDMHSGIIDTAKICTASHWHRYGTNFVDFLHELETIFKGNTCIRGSCLMTKKPRDKKSRVRVSLTLSCVGRVLLIRCINWHSTLYRSLNPLQSEGRKATKGVEGISLIDTYNSTINIDHVWRFFSGLLCKSSGSLSQTFSFPPAPRFYQLISRGGHHLFFLWSVNR